MPNKRKPSDSATRPSPYSKRARPSYAEDDQDDDENPRSVTPYERPRNHPVFGQKSAFPGLDSGDGDELFYGPAEDGLEYLRMVRSEADSLPILFTAAPAKMPPTENPHMREESKDKDKDIQQNEEEEEKKEPTPESAPAPQAPTDGIYSDGVYISLTAPKPAVANDEGYSDAQASYNNLLHHRYLLLRSILKCIPPSEAITALDDSHPISLPRRSKSARKEWRHLLLTVDPQPVQLACMDMESVLGVLGIVTRMLSDNVRSGNKVLVRRTGAWAWGLLGKCRDVGQLGTEDVGDIRDLGKRAVTILQKMKEGEKVQADKDGYVPHEASDAEGYGEGDADGDGVVWGDDDGEAAPPDPDLDQADAENGTNDVELQSAKERLQARLLDTGNGSSPHDEVEDKSRVEEEDASPDVSTQARAMLDMIITVVGEHYGQRDLLEAREIWAESLEGVF